MGIDLWGLMEPEGSPPSPPKPHKSMPINVKAYRSLYQFSIELFDTERTKLEKNHRLQITETTDRPTERRKNSL